MALDTEKRRRMALGMFSGVGVIFPIADDTFDTADRATMLGVFSSVPSALYRETFDGDSSITRAQSMNSHVTRSITLNSKLDS